MTAPFSEDFMHVSTRFSTAVVVALTLASAQFDARLKASRSAAAPVPFPLTVDSIMRGPKLVGYPQTGLRWSGDSSRLYFEWRRPGDDEPATYVVSKDGSDLAPRKRDPRDTDSQKFIKTEEEKLIAHTRVEAEKKKKREEKDKADALPKFELADRQSATDLQLSPDGKHVFIVVAERADAAKRPNVPNYVTESSYTEDIPARTYVGDAQDKRALAILNHETGKSVMADGAFAAGRSPKGSRSDGGERSDGREREASAERNDL